MSMGFAAIWAPPLLHVTTLTTGCRYRENECWWMADSTVERADRSADRQAVGRRPTEDHDHLHDRGAQPRRGRQTDRAEGGELAGVHVAVAAETPLGRQGAGLLRQHLRRPVPLLARVPRQHASPCHYSAHRQVTHVLTTARLARWTYLSPGVFLFSYYYFKSNFYSVTRSGVLGKADMCERLVQGRYSAMRWPGVEPATCWSQVQRHNHYTPPNYTTAIYSFRAAPEPILLHFHGTAFLGVFFLK